MSGSARTKRSVYMEWAKTWSHAKLNLATSGLMSVPMSEFPVRVEDLEITPQGAYGYAPLRQRLAQHSGVPEDCVVAATGCSMANHLAMAAVLDPGDEVLIEQPVYGPMLDVVEYLQARVKRIPRKFEAGFAADRKINLARNAADCAEQSAQSKRSADSRGNGSFDWRNSAAYWSACAHGRGLS
jgi:Aminotransferase class I and II